MTRGALLPLFLAFWWVTPGWSQEPEESPPQPSQTRAKTFVPSPSASDRAVSAGQIKILEIDYSSRREDVPINARPKQPMTNSLSERDCHQVVTGEAHCQGYDLAVGFSPLAFVV